MRALPLIAIALALACAGCASGRPMAAPSQTPTVAAAANSVAPVATTASPVPSPSTRSVPVAACHSRLSAWLRSGVRYEVNSLSNAINSFDQASNPNVYDAITFLDLAASAAHLAEKWPIPACADPGGYWAAALSDVQQAASDAGTPASAQAAGGVPVTIYQDIQQHQSWQHAAADGIVSNGAALGAGAGVAVVMTALFGTSVVAAGAGTIVGGAFAVGVGDFVHHMFQQNWSADWHHYGVLADTGHAIANSASQTGHDMAHSASDIWHAVF